MGGCSSVGTTLHRFFFGEFLERYELGAKLGEGSFGSVYECTDKVTREKYAVKKMNRSSVEDVKNEIEICTTLNHENIVGYYETYSGRGWFYMVFELIKGYELFNAIGQRVHYSERDATNYMYQILKAVEYCHGKNIIHRDLKPANIMLRMQDDCVKLIDFGLATVISSDPQCWYGLQGTIPYIAPEMLRREIYGKPVDIWACGILFYNLLSGIHPFYSTEEHTMRQLIQNGPLTFPLEKFKVTMDSVNLIKSLLNPVQGDRPTASGALIQFQELNYRSPGYMDEIHVGTILRLRRWQYGVPTPTE